MKTVRLTSVSFESGATAEYVTHLATEVNEALMSIVRFALIGGLLLGLLRMTFLLTGSDATSIARTVFALSAWLVIPFRALPPMGATTAALVALALLSGIVSALDNVHRSYRATELKNT
jgi:hypothetical protein